MDAACQFYTHYLEDPDNAYYTHAMVYSPGIVLIRDDYGEWRSPVEVDVLTRAAVNAGEIRRGLGSGVGVLEEERRGKEKGERESYGGEAETEGGGKEQKGERRNSDAEEFGEENG